MKTLFGKKDTKIPQNVERVLLTSKRRRSKMNKKKAEKVSSFKKLNMNSHWN